MKHDNDKVVVVRNLTPELKTTRASLTNDVYAIRTCQWLIFLHNSGVKKIKLTKLLLRALTGEGLMQETAVVKWERCGEEEGQRRDLTGARPIRVELSTALSQGFIQ